MTHVAALSPPPASTPSAASAVFPGDSEMAARCRAFDWADTPLGPVDVWPPHLRAAAGLVLASGFSTALYYGPDAIHVYNDACVPSLGAHHPAALGRPLFETFPEARAALAPLHARVWRGETVTLTDQAVPMRRDGVLGESVWTFSYAPLRDERGAVAGVLVTAVDMTARVADEARLRAAEARQAFLLALNDRLRPLTDPAEIQAAATRALGEHLGVARVGYGEVDAAQAHVTVHRDWGDGRIPSVVGTWRLDDFGPGFTASLKAGHTLLIPDVRCDPRTAAADVVVRYDAIGTRAFLGVQLVKHGRLVALLFMNHPAPRDWPADEVALVEDTCARLWAAVERARAEEALAASEARYRALRTSLDAAFCVVEVLVDGDGAPVDYRFLETNPAFARQTGLANPVGRTARALVPELEDYWVEAYGRVARTGEPLRLEDDAAGLGRRFEVFAFRVDAPEARRVALLVTDVTAARVTAAERERLLADAESARREADAANLAKSQFLAAMSHELRTPLNAIGGYAELMDLGLHGAVTDAQRTALARIQASQRHLLGLIAGVLDYARVEAGAVAYRLTEVPVAEAVAEAEALVAPQLRAKGLVYAWAGAPPAADGRPLCVRADREKLQQVLLNLLGNAVKFTHARDGAPGRVEVSCAAGDEVADAGNGARVHIRVRDTGEGIAPEQLERVFEPFVQVDQRLTRPHEGVGLGLAISRDLARGMGGDLTAESTPGAGSTFTLTLPCA